MNGSAARSTSKRDGGDGSEETTPVASRSPLPPRIRLAGENEVPDGVEDGRSQGERERDRSHARTVGCAPECPARALIFDFNGTLSHDEPVLCAVYQELFAEQGRPLTESAYYEQLCGLSEEAIIAGWLGVEGERCRRSSSSGSAGTIERAPTVDVLARRARHCVTRPSAFPSRSARAHSAPRSSRCWRGRAHEPISLPRDRRRRRPGKPAPDGYLLAVELGSGLAPGASSRSRTPRQVSPPPRPPGCAAWRCGGRSRRPAPRRGRARRRDRRRPRPAPARMTWVIAHRGASPTSARTRSRRSSGRSRSASTSSSSTSRRAPTASSSCSTTPARPADAAPRPARPAHARGAREHAIPTLAEVVELVPRAGRADGRAEVTAPLPPPRSRRRTVALLDHADVVLSFQRGAL